MLQFISKKFLNQPDMKFIIQHNEINSGQLQLIEESTKGLPREFVGVIPFDRKITSERELVGTDFIPYGSTLLINLAHKMKWKGTHFNDNFNYGACLKNRDDMLNNGLDTIDNWIEKLNQFNDNTMLFSRPSADLKQYAGLTKTTKELRTHEFSNLSILVNKSCT